MKKLFILAYALFTINQSFACDICGCNSGNYFMGPFPQFTKHFIGMRYSFQNFSTVLKSDKSQFSKDYFKTTELLLGTKLGKKWQLLAFVPYSMNHTISDDGIANNNGLGDITLMGSYNLINSIRTTQDTEAVRQQVWIGGGAKLPTGRFKPNMADFLASVNSQPGTGSIDFLAVATYLLQFKKWAVNSTATYKYNQSAYNFTFGNRFAATVFVSRSFQCKAITFSPNAGLLYTNLNANKITNTKVNDTGGYTLLSAAGFQARYRQFTIGCNAQIPLLANLSSGQTHIKMGGMVQLSYTF